MGLKKLLVALVISLVLLPVSPVMADSPTVSEIANELICQCGCNMVLSNCSHDECSSRDTMIALIEQKLAQGESREQIIDYFVAQYGEQVLASPPKKGFNLVAWILPFVAILVGGGVIYIAVREWVRRGQREPAGDTTKAEKEEDEKYRKQLEKELDQFSEGGFR